tara:strand:- start:742 stop:1266 length:525 start_codon:yes stop_codon:yes gene_type:complete
MGKIADDWNDQWRQRDAQIKESGFARIDQAVAESIAEYSPLIEIGAGSGKLAEMIAAQGGDIIATDDYSGDYPFGTGDHFPVANMDARDAVLAYPDRNVLCSWPSYSHNWFTDACKEIETDIFLIYIGEGEGGCTADEEFHPYLSQCFTHIQHIPMLQYYGIHDCCDVYKRNKK